MTKHELSSCMRSLLKSALCLIAAATLLSVVSIAQTAPSLLFGVTHSSTLTFIKSDGSCMRGTIVRSDVASVTIDPPIALLADKPFKPPPVTLQRDSIVQVSQENALLFSGRSSWKNVTTLRLYPREALVLTTKSGKEIKGTIVSATPESVTLKHDFGTTVFPKSDVRTADYLRLRPATDGFNYALEEAPWALFMYPELYSRIAGFEGRIPVRLYDSSKPEDDRNTGVKYCPNS